jgi:hypothetical protein
VNSKFKYILKLVRSPLLEILFGSTEIKSEHARVCVRRLVRRTGSGSGLYISNRETIKDRRWINAWLAVRQVGISGYRIDDINL